MLFVLFAAFCSRATQPPVNNIVEMQWLPLEGNGTNPVDYCIWITTNAGARWNVVGSTRNVTGFTHTNRTAINPTNVYYAITGLPWKPFGVRRESELTVLHWAPSGTITNAAGTARLAGIGIVPGKAIKLSADLRVFEDWLMIRALDTNGIELTNIVLQLDHRASTHKPQLFYGYPVTTNPPQPSPKP